MTRQSDAIVREMNLLFEQLQVEFAHRLVAKLQRPPGEGGTPVDTGYARSRWVIAELGGQIDVINDAPYIMRLNDGWSRQAPAGFIERCIDEVIAEMNLVISRPIRILEHSGAVFEYFPAATRGAA
jgi:hypothetical protein